MDIRRSVFVLILAVLVIATLTGCPPAKETPAPTDHQNVAGDTPEPENGNGTETGTEETPVEEHEVTGYMASYTGADAENVGSESCLMCHSDMGPGEGASHVTLFEGEGGMFMGTGCEKCHGPGGNHNGDPVGILNPDKMPIGVLVEGCSMCHSEKGGYEKDAFLASTHYANGTGCVVCHSGHSEYPHYLVDADVLNVCGTCHADMVQGLAEGTHGAEGMTCTDCHNPHQ